VPNIGIQDDRYLINTAQQHRHAGMVGEDLAAAQLSQQLSVRRENWWSTPSLGLIAPRNATDRRLLSLYQHQMHRFRTLCTTTSPQCASRSEGRTAQALHPACSRLDLATV